MPDEGLWLNAAMAGPSRFADEPNIAAALDSAADAAVKRLAVVLPELEGTIGADLTMHLRQHLADLLSGRASTAGPPSPLPPLLLGDDAFGDPFSLADLPLPREGSGYAVQRLNTDLLLDQATDTFLPVRDPALRALYPSFAAARCAARAWIVAHAASLEEEPLAIVPATYDETMQRHVLIYGVLTSSP